MSRRKIIGALTLATLIAACGGGGPPSEEQVPPPVVLRSFVYVANNLNVAGNVAAFSSDTSSGALTAVAGSPFLAGPNPNSVVVDPSGRFAYAANGNSISGYAID